MSYSEKTSKVTFRIFSTIFIIYENVLNDKYCFDVSKSALCYKSIVDITIVEFRKSFLLTAWLFNTNRNQNRNDRIDEKFKLWFSFRMKSKNQGSFSSSAKYISSSTLALRSVFREKSNSISAIKSSKDFDKRFVIIQFLSKTDQSTEPESSISLITIFEQLGQCVSSCSPLYSVSHEQYSDRLWESSSSESDYDVVVKSGSGVKSVFEAELSVELASDSLLFLIIQKLLFAWLCRQKRVYIFHQGGSREFWKHQKRFVFVMRNIESIHNFICVIEFDESKYESVVKSLNIPWRFLNQHLHFKISYSRLFGTWLLLLYPWSKLLYP